MIAFPVYRSYLPEGAAHWAAAIAGPRPARPDLADALVALDAQVRAEPGGELATRIQQTSGMVVAKGTEDTTFYRYTRFAALNEVGGNPDRFGLDVEEFHRLAAEREAGHPASMTTLTTHDTKRSEDTRARMAVLAEVPGEFAEAVRRWTARRGIDEPSLNLLAWQTLVATWPIEPPRLRDYLDKAAKEAKLRTSWTDHDEEFEAAVAAWPERGAWATPSSPRTSRRSSRAIATAGLVELARPEAGAADRARRPGRLPGHRAVGLLAGRPGQPPPGRLRGPARDPGADRSTANCRRSTRRARRSCWSCTGR